MEALTDLLRPPADRPIDVVCVGNAIVDVLAQVDDAFLGSFEMVKGSMQLTDPERGQRIYDAMPPAIEVSGGSAGNTAAGLASLGSAVTFVGNVADDELGHVYMHDIRAAGVEWAGTVGTGDDGAAGTGRCLVCVTPDAQRTLNTSLGVAGRIGPRIGAEVVDDAKVVYVEGYLWDEPVAKDTIRRLLDRAAERSTPVAFSLSDGFCVDRHRAEFLDLIDARVDILFANADEICSLFETDSFDDAVSRISGHCAIACITRSEHGSVIVTDTGTRVEVPAMPAELVDTTGAGDLYAAGVLHGWAAGLDLEASGRIGSLAAAEVISHLGARPQDDLAALVRRMIR